LHRKKKTKKLKIVAKDHYEEDYLEPSKKKKLKNKKVPEDLPQENASNLSHNVSDFSYLYVCCYKAVIFKRSAAVGYTVVPAAPPKSAAE